MARNTSAAYKAQITGNRQFCVKAVITFADGTTEILSELKDFMKVKTEDSCSGSSEFEIGAAIINEAVIVLNNRTGRFTGKNFFGARIVLYAGIVVNGQPELLKMGHYLVNEPVSPGVSICLTAYDNMIFTEKKYVPGIPFPATRAQIAQDVCAQCGLQLKSAGFPKADKLVTTAPEGATCREILAAIAQLGCAFVRCDNDGLVEIRWYSEKVDHVVSLLYSKSICTDDVVITGVTVENGDTVAEAGEDGYRIGIKDNILLETGKEQETADYLAGKLIGMRFRPFSAKCKSDPSIEAGDRITLTDENGFPYESYITTTIFTVLDAQTVSCDAATPAANSSQRNSQIVKAILASKKYTEEYVEAELSEYEKAEKLLSGLIIGALGFYETVETLEDGSTIRYMHDKPNLEDSRTIWKQSIDGFAVSTDAGETWQGIDKNGNAVMNVLSVYGLNANLINSGTLMAKDKDGNIVFSVNVDTGEVIINASSITMKSGKTVQQEVESSVASVKTEYYLSASSAELTGGEWSTVAPDWVNGKYMWTRTVTVKGDGTETVSEPVCISGAAGSSGEDATLLRIDSSRGTVFKNSQVATVLSAVIYHGSHRITDNAELRQVFGNGAHIEWKWQRMGEDSFGSISADDARIGAGGFTFTLSPEDVNTKVTFMAQLTI